MNINHRNIDGHNALYYASEEGNTEIVQLLIDKGIDVQQTMVSKI